MLCGATLPEHWARLQVYANRIRIASVIGPRMAEIYSSVWPFLAASCRGAPLMPRLRDFKAFYFSISEVLALALLLTPTLRHFNVWFADEFTAENRPRSPHVSASLLQTLPLMVPELEHFTFDAGFYIPDPYLHSLMQFKQLKSLSMPENLTLQESMLQMLSLITTLQSLSCTVDLSGISAPAFPPQAFQGLTGLTLRGHSDHLVAFVLACEFPNLAHTKFFITQPPSAGQPRNLATALFLSFFVAHFTHAFAARPSCLVEYFEPLLAFPGITLFEIAFSFTEPSIRDDDLARFGAAWLLLTTFYVSHRKHYSQSYVVRPTLSGPIDLARRCPSLTTLYFPELEPRPIPEKSTVPALGHRLRSACQWMDNITPPLTLQVYMDVAAIIDRVRYYRPPGAGWVDVLQYINVMRLGRENGRAYADSGQDLLQRA
ncbi:hypothetical protein V8D89_001648 [Ganoderma adspersum]